MCGTVPWVQDQASQEDPEPWQSKAKLCPHLTSEYTEQNLGNRASQAPNINWPGTPCCLGDTRLRPGCEEGKHRWRHLNIAFEGPELGVRPDLLWATPPGLWGGGGRKTTGMAPLRIFNTFCCLGSARASPGLTDF